MAFQIRFQQARSAAQPSFAYRQLAQSLASEGLTAERIYQEFEAFLTHLRNQPNFHDEDEESILDVMDSLTGWCHPAARLLPDQEPV